MLLSGLPAAAGSFSDNRGWLTLVVLAGGLFLAAPLAPGTTDEAVETLLPGQIRERSIAGGELQFYRVAAADLPLLLTVDQRGINLVVEAQGPAARLETDTGDNRWGLEVLLLETAGEYRIEVHSREKAVAPGRYTIGIDELRPSSDARYKALALMSRAGQEAFKQTPDAWRRALISYLEALAEWHSLGERRWEAEILNIVAILEYYLSELRPAAEDLERALPIWRELKDPRREAATLNDLGVVRQRLGELAAAREALNEALPLWLQLDDRFGEGETRGNLCLLDHESGALRAALACYVESLERARNLGELDKEIEALNNIGGVFGSLGEPDAALQYHHQALSLRQGLGDRIGQAQSLNNIAVIHRALGEWQEALRYYTAAGWWWYPTQRSISSPSGRCRRRTRANPSSSGSRSPTCLRLRRSRCSDDGWRTVPWPTNGRRFLPIRSSRRTIHA